MLEDELELLGKIILRKLNEEFDLKHLSGNLIRTIRVESSSDEIKIHIPAEIYDVLEYKRRGVVVPTGEGSYASKLDIEGSSYMVGSKRYSPHNHIGYINKVVNEAIEEWSHRLPSGSEMKVEG